MMDFKYRKYKGKDMFDFPEDYTVIDIETTGLNPDENEIIEVGAVKVRDRKIIDEFSSFVSPDVYKRQVLGQPKWADLYGDILKII